MLSSWGHLALELQSFKTGFGTGKLWGHIHMQLPSRAQTTLQRDRLSGHFHHSSWDSLKLIAFRFEKSHYQSHSQKHVHVRAWLLRNFFLIYVQSQQSNLPLGVVWAQDYCTMHYNYFCWMLNFVPILSNLRTVPRSVVKATRPSPFRVWSGHVTSSSPAAQLQTTCIVPTSINEFFITTNIA